MNRIAVLALALLVVPALVVPTSDDASATHVELPAGSGTTWWGPTGIGQGHHLRVGVTVQNTITETVGTTTVRANLDLADLLPKAGWIHTGGTRTFLKGFEFDQDSIRVVRVTSLTGGQLVVHDSARSGPDRFVVPSLVLDRPVEPPGGDLRTGNPTTDPRLTVYWQAHDLQPKGDSGDTQYFHVYLDTRTNGDHGPAGLQGSDVGAVEAIHWIGAASLFYGTLPPTDLSQEDVPTVTLIGLYPDTKVDVKVRLTEGTPFQDHPQKPTLTLDANKKTLVGLGNGDTSVAFQLKGDKPFLAYVESTGYVPSLEGGLTGKKFVVSTGDLGVTTSLNLIAPHGRPVTVTATPGSGTAQTFHMNDATNPRPYTLGVWSNGQSGCTPNNVPGTARLNSNTLYVLSASDDIQVQVAGPMTARQVPTRDGGPVGTVAAVSLEEAYHQGQACTRRVDDRSWWAMASAATGAYLDSPERNGVIDPQPTQNQPNLRHAVPVAPAYAGAFDRHDTLTNRPLYLHTEDPALFLAGSIPGNRIATSGATAHVGGLGASGIGPAEVFGYHHETRLEVRADRLDSGVTTTTRYLSAGESLRLTDLPDGDLLQGWTITSDKPIAAYGLAGRPGYLSGMPLLAKTTVGNAEYRGYLLDIASATGVEPQTQSTIPGASVTYRFVVHNRGRNVDGAPIADTAEVRVASVPPGWTAKLDRGDTQAIVPLAPGASETIELTVTPPSNAAARTQATIAVVATSSNNRALEVSSSTVTSIKRSFDVGAWFDGVGLSKSQERNGPQGEPIVFKVAVKNEGTIADSIDLEVSGLQPGWDAVLLQGGTEVAPPISLAADTFTLLDLKVTPPPNLADGLLVVHVKATSTSESSAFDRVSATAIVRAPADIEATPEFLSRLVEPGKEAVFPIHVANKGAGGIDLDLEAAADAPDGWGDAEFYIIEPSSGDRIPGLNIEPGQELDFLVVVKAADDAIAGDLATIRALARASSGEAAFEVAFTAVASAVHDLRTSVAATPLVARTDGTPLPFVLTVDNRGNLDERFDVDAAEYAAGWSLQAPAATTVLDKTTLTTLDLALQGPVGATPREFNLTLRLRSDDGALTLTKLPVVVPKAHDLLATPGTPDPAQPGRPVLVPVDVTNTGNAPARVLVRAAIDEPWALRDTTATDLAPGATTRILVGWHVPPGASIGKSTHSLELVLQKLGTDPEEAVRTVTANIDVDRPQLRASLPQSKGAPGGNLVVTTLLNDGNRTAYDVRVQLLAGGKVVDEVTVDVLEKAGRATVSLLDDERHASLTVLIDPDDTIVEANEADNQLDVQALARDAPGVGVGALLALFVSIVWVTRRSRR